MTHTRLLAPLLLAGALLAGGCATVRYSHVGGTAMVEIENTGWYLLDFIPLGSGDPDYPNDSTCRLFDDTVSLENNMRLLNWAVRRDGAKRAVDVTSHMTDEKVFIIFLKRLAYHTSARLIKD